MSTSKPDRPAEEVMWAGPSGELWLANAHRFEATLRPIGDALLQQAQLTRGEHVLEIGCGAGAMSLEIAQRVAPGGSITGLDISPDLVAEATRHAAAAGATVARFVLGDAAHATLPGQADVLLSRFGVMFFTDPSAAFKHMHTLVRSGGRAALAVWAPLLENTWMLELRKVIAAHFEIPVPPPRIPGPFAFDEPAYLRDILTQAGFSQIEIVPFKTELPVAGPNSNPDLAADFLLKALSIAQRAADAPEVVRQQIRHDLVERLKTFRTPSGVRMAGSVWLATAKA